MHRVEVNVNFSDNISGSEMHLFYSKYMSLVVRNRSWGLPTRSDTNRAVQPQKMAIGLKFRIYIEEGSLYPCSENKGADQLRSYCAADLRLCFRICKKPVFS